ncbi:hypothetical protein BDW_00445 [Bdellovibrio bacteriovorus W]|nr:hypothetical protein BDW_00445 [Bdellovibrio bacteriovorus W]
MKKTIKFMTGIVIVSFASIAMANPKCSHRIASNTNDLFKNTNPVRERVAKNTKTNTVRTSTNTKTGVN